MMSAEHARPVPGREAIYLQPICCEVTDRARKGHDAAVDVDDDSDLFERLREYLAAFFHGSPVRLLPTKTVRVTRERGHLLGKMVRWRDWCPGNGEAMPHGQLDAGNLLDALKPRRTKSGIVKGTGALPADGMCVLGVTLIDLFCDDDDVFTAGLACLQSRAGIFSFHRYSSDGADAGVRLFRACKTAAHELLHMHGIGHCVHRSCLMNGTGHLKEDFVAPPYLCPVDLAKLQASLGARADLVGRYRALLRFCEAAPTGFDEQAEWLRRALAAATGREESDRAAGAPSEVLEAPSFKRPRVGARS